MHAFIESPVSDAPLCYAAPAFLASVSLALNIWLQLHDLFASVIQLASLQTFTVLLPCVGGTPCSKTALRRVSSIQHQL